ncbi:MAG: DUF5007 domain-containing protein [Ginsengibacter sp.]|jgi:hypothetical protein
MSTSDKKNYLLILYKQKGIRMNNKKINIQYYTVTMFLLVIVLFFSCKKFLPQERETVGPDSQFSQDVFQPVLGRTTEFANDFFKGSTTYPSTFKIINPRRRNGDPASELTDVFPVMVWKGAYDGKEKSIAEIEAKRTLENRPVFEINAHSGEFTMWAEGSSSFIRSQPDSGYLFDVELSNSGGRRIYRNLKLMPFRERPFEPSNYDVISGQPLSNGISPSVVSSIKGVHSGRYLSASDVDVYVRKISSATPGNTLTFRFLDTLYKPINPTHFATTDWQGLVHGFNMKMDSASVTYTVAFPIPLIQLPTRYTSPDGSMARVSFSYSRLGFAGVREDAVLGLDFAIYDPGDWEIVFAFKNDNPKFDND